MEKDIATALVRMRPIYIITELVMKLVNGPFGLEQKHIQIPWEITHGTSVTGLVELSFSIGMEVANLHVVLLFTLSHQETKTCVASGVKRMRLYTLIKHVPQDAGCLIPTSENGIETFVTILLALLLTHMDMDTLIGMIGIYILQENVKEIVHTHMIS